MLNTDQIISRILNTAPYQLPPVIHTSGTYHIDVRYRGVGFNIVSTRLEHVMEQYLEFVVGQNDIHRFGANDFDKLPMPYGAKIGIRYPKQDIDHTVIE